MNSMHFIAAAMMAAAASGASAAPAATDATLFTPDQCRGSRMPYPTEIVTAEHPDSLLPVMVNHVGRHGARYATSPKRFQAVIKALEEASSRGTLTARGRKMLELTRRAMAHGDGRWGQLDSLGVAEQQQIATRLFEAYPQLIVGRKVDAVASYVPRCVASMDAFVQTLDRLSRGNVDVAADSGPEFNAVLRPFEVDSAYLDFRREEPYRQVLDDFTHAEEPVEVAYSMVGEEIPEKRAVELTSDTYYVLSSLAASGMDASEVMDIISLEEYNRMWQVDNLRQYITRTASTISAIPAEIASDLVWDLIETTDDFIEGNDSVAVYLRFGHAETIMPLASLLRLPGCYYLTHYFDTVSLHWQSWHVVPMASNVRQILFRSRNTGLYYLRTDLNEVPVPLIPGCADLYVPWERARYFMASVAGA